LARGDLHVEVKEFLVEGKVRLKDEWRRFRLRRRGVKVEDVKEALYSEMGGRFKVKRDLVKIERVEILEGEAIGEEARG